MKIAIACDHGALALKNKMVEVLTREGYEVKDFGTYTADSCDYPDYAAPAAKAVAAGECDKGIVLCTTGIGVSITANKVKGIRCALLSDVMSARLTREHNDTNMMAIGAPPPSRWPIRAMMQVMTHTPMTLLPMSFISLPMITSNIPASVMMPKYRTENTNRAAVGAVELKPALIMAVRLEKSILPPATRIRPRMKG